MDDKNQRPVFPDHPAIQQPVTPPIRTETNANQEIKAKLNISDSEAQSLLTLSNLQTNQRSKVKIPTKLLIAIVALISLVVIISYLLGAFKTGSNSQSSNLGGVGLPNQSNTTSGSDTTNQINQDVKTCSNPVNALTVC